MYTLGMGRIIWGLLVATLGFFITRYAHWIVENFGYMQWAEAHLGGSRTAWRLIGVAITVAGLLVATNLAGALVLAVLGPAIPG
jgi:hypothetical protein